MPNQASTRSHYQLRLVKRIDKGKIVTHAKIAYAKGVDARDKVLDVFEANSDRSALQRAREYCKSGDKKKGPLPGEFLGVVLVKFESDPAKPGLIRRGGTPGAATVVNRRRRVAGKTAWIYYVDPEIHAYHVDSKSHMIGKPVLLAK